MKKNTEGSANPGKTTLHSIFILNFIGVFIIDTRAHTPYIIKLILLLHLHPFLLPPAPYVNYIQKDPGSPCSLTEALEYLQVDVLEDLMEKDSLKTNPNQPPKNKPHNFTVVAMEGCHSFIILDWARPLKDDMVSGEERCSKTFKSNFLPLEVLFVSLPKLQI